MQNSWTIFRKSIEIIIGNLQQAVRLSGTLFVLAVFASTALNVIMTGAMIVDPAIMQIDSSATPSEQVIMAQKAFKPSMALFFGSLIFFVAMSWIAIAWHRFVLLEEGSADLIPNFNISRLSTYLGKTIVLILIIAVGLVLPLMIATTIFRIAGLNAFLPLVSLGLFVCVYYLFFRAGLVLPAIALDQRMTFSQSFAATQSLSKEIWGLALIIVGLSFGTAVLLGSFIPNNIIGVLTTAVVQWFMVMISASLLTTLYGRTVEQRALF